MFDIYKEHEQFNAHQEDTRKRCEFLAKAVFLISGTALTVSINLFLGEKPQKVPIVFLDYLRWSWTFLFISILCFVIVIGLMIVRDYTFGERWRRHLADTDYVAKPVRRIDPLMWMVGASGTVAFMAGLGGLAWVSYSLVALMCTGR